MTEGDAGPDKGQRARLLAGRISCFIGLLFGVVQIAAALPGDGIAASAGTLGIAFCILGYYLGSRKPATAVIFLCTASVLFGLATSQGIL